MSLYYNESPFVNGETPLDSAHFNPMAEAISFSCLQVIDEGDPNEADIGVAFDMVLAGANVCCSFTQSIGDRTSRRYSTETFYEHGEDCVTFRWTYSDAVDGVASLIVRQTSVYRDATWESSQTTYPLVKNGDN